MQIDINNNLNISSTNNKQITNSDSITYTKSKQEDKFGAVLQKEKQNLSSNDKKEINEVDTNEIVTSKSKVSDLKDNLTEPIGNVDVIESEVDKTIDMQSIKLEINVDKDVKELSIDDILSYLATIVELITKIAPSQMNTGDQKVSVNENTLNSEILNVQTDNFKINNLVADKSSLITSLNSINNGSNMDQEDAVKVINNLLTILETKGDNELLNKENLTAIQGLINELGVKLNGEVESKDIKSYDVLKELVKDVKVEASKLVETKTSKEMLQSNTGDKALALNEETTKSKNADMISVGKVNEVNYANEKLVDKDLTDSGKDSSKNSSSSLNKEISKEEKLLSSILDDGEEKADNKFASIIDRLGIKTTTQISVEPKVINKESIAVDVVKSVKFMVTNNIKEMTIKINPEQLGEISIKVIEEGGAMKASIKASSKETYNLLSQQLGDIKKHLGEQNIKIQEVNISIYDEDATFYKDGQFSSNSFQDGSSSRQDNRYLSSGEFIEDELGDNIELNTESNIDMLV